MKITDVTVTLFEWTDLPDVSYHFIRRRPGEVHDQGLVTIHTDEGVEGHAFLGKEIVPASADAKELIRLMKREQMRPAGSTLDVIEAASNSVCAQMISQEESVNAFLASWSGRIDPVVTYSLMLGSGSYYNSNNTVYVPADDLIAELQATFDREEQKPIFDKLNRVWVDHLPMLPLYRSPTWWPTTRS